MLVPLPSGKDPVNIIGAGDAILDAWRCVGPYLTERPDCAVLVAGGWPSRIGIYAAAVAMAMGASRVDYWDDDGDRRAAAAVFGATVISHESQLGSSYAIVVDACGDAAMLRRAILAAEPEGIVTSCTIHRGNATALPLQDMYWKGITFKTGRPNLRAQIEPVLDLCCAGFEPSKLATLIAPFEQAHEAFLDQAISVAVSRAASAAS